jgi:hypothetical protein
MQQKTSSPYTGGGKRVSSHIQDRTAGRECESFSRSTHGAHESWYRITERAADMFFNGEEAVTFDYANSTALVSVPFSSSSDSLFLFALSIFRHYRLWAIRSDRDGVV